MDRLKGLLENLFKEKKLQKIALLVAALAVAALAATSAYGKKPSTSAASIQYEELLERRIAELLSNIEGVGAVRVMVTVDAHTAAAEPQSFSIELSGVTTPVVIASSAPSISGVAVVCEGGDAAVVRERIINMLATVLNLGQGDIYVTKMESGKKP